MINKMLWKKNKIMILELGMLVTTCHYDPTNFLLLEKNFFHKLCNSISLQDSHGFYRLATSSRSVGEN